MRVCGVQRASSSTKKVASHEHVYRHICWAMTETAAAAAALLSGGAGGSWEAQLETARSVIDGRLSMAPFPRRAAIVWDFLASQPLKRRPSPLHTPDFWAMVDRFLGWVASAGAGAGRARNAKPQFMKVFIEAISALPSASVPPETVRLISASLRQFLGLGPGMGSFDELVAVTSSAAGHLRDALGADDPRGDAGAPDGRARRLAELLDVSIAGLVARHSAHRNKRKVFTAVAGRLLPVSVPLRVLLTRATGQVNTVLGRLDSCLVEILMDPDHIPHYRTAVHGAGGVAPAESFSHEPSPPKRRKTASQLESDRAIRSYPKQLFEVLGTAAETEPGAAAELAVVLLGGYLARSTPARSAPTRPGHFAVCVDFCNLAAGTLPGTATLDAVAVAAAFRRSMSGSADHARLVQLGDALGTLASSDIYNETEDTAAGEPQLGWYRGVARALVAQLSTVTIGEPVRKFRELGVCRCLRKLLELNHRSVEEVGPDK